MKLIITDEGYIWNHNNPYLEKLKDMVVVICLNGIAVTDKYRCVVLSDPASFKETTSYGIGSRKYAALVSSSHTILYDAIKGHEDLVFLTDGNPCSLFSFLYMMDRFRFSFHSSSNRMPHRMHLIAAGPCPLEQAEVSKTYYELLSDLTDVTSVLFYGLGDYKADLAKELSSAEDYYKKAQEELGEILPHVLNSINRIEGNGSYFFDFSSLQYMSLNGGFKNSTSLKDPLTFLHYRQFDKYLAFDPEKSSFAYTFSQCLTPGLIFLDLYPNDSSDAKAIIEAPVSRPDGKEICNYLRKLRLKLAKANDIEFFSEECSSQGPCAGTCAKCDFEAEYLRKALENIPEEDRIYPEFNLKGVKWQ